MKKTLMFEEAVQMLEDFVQRLENGNMTLDESLKVFEEAVKLAIESGKISTSLLQRRLGVGYGRAAKLIDIMEEKGYVSAANGTKPREVLITMNEFLQRKADGDMVEE